ncbi:phosphoribosyltransferase family protein [Mesorhizobium sp.]|uniref:phosphoribosyltransferase family protein n=1 Tax=Mesorhizobium sp. TaxID=1871066 RepID=UPI003BAB4238
MSIAGKTAIIIDDGIATGTTMKVMIRALRQRSPRRSSWRFGRCRPGSRLDHLPQPTGPFRLPQLPLPRFSPADRRASDQHSGGRSIQMQRGPRGISKPHAEAPRGLSLPLA